MLQTNNEIMACFPRVFFNKQKNSFTPAEDENLDTVLNANGNSVVSRERFQKFCLTQTH